MIAGVYRASPRLTWAALLGVGLLTSGCMQQGAPLIAERSPVFDAAKKPTYVVQRGDTLYSIAWRYGLEHRELASANGISAPYVIYPGQRLSVSAPLTIAPERVRSNQDEGPQKPQPRTGKQKNPDADSKRVSKPGIPAVEISKTTPGSWVWPLDIPPAKKFGQGSKGLDFRIELEQARPRAVAKGEVVYAGTGIGGYERLVIVKHSEALLSAYGFDGALAVREREQVQKAGVVGVARRRGPQQYALHFELREDGRPINPQRYLP